MTAVSAESYLPTREMVTRDCSFASSAESSEGSACDLSPPAPFAGSPASGDSNSADPSFSEVPCDTAFSSLSREGSWPAASALAPRMHTSRTVSISRMTHIAFVLFLFSPINQTSPFRTCFCIFRPYLVNDFDLYAVGFEHSVILSHNPSGDCVLYAIRIRAFGVASLNKSSFFQQIFFGIVCRAFDHICKHRLKCFANLRSRTHSGGNQVFSGHSQLM